MAARRHRPGRTLIVFFLGVAIMYGLVALGQSWKPALGLDLQGGLRITLTALGDPSDENFEEARRIIDQRVNGSGVVEAEVTAQSGEYIVVEIPGSTENRRETEELVRRQAQLRFRLVACGEQSAVNPCASGAGGTPLGRAPVALAEPTDEPGGKKGKIAHSHRGSRRALQKGGVHSTNSPAHRASLWTAPGGVRDLTTAPRPMPPA